MSKEQIAELESQLKSVTDNVGKLMDMVLQKGYKPAFICSHSGLLLPGDYVKGWGRDYGIGLGPDPVSEVFDSDYDTPPPKMDNTIDSLDQIMHPVGPSFAQVDFLMVDPSRLVSANLAILDKDDKRMKRRCEIVLARQLVNPKSKIRALRAAFTSNFNTTGRGV